MTSNAIDAPKDYEVTMRVRNNWLLRAMQAAGVRSVTKLSEMSGVSINTIHRLLKFKIPYIKKDGEWRDSVDKIAIALRLPPDALVPPQHIEQAMEKNIATMEMDYAEVTALIEGPPPDPAQLIEIGERSAAISEAMSAVLTEREQAVIRQRFGIGDDEKTLEEVGEQFGITRNRVGQIEAKALRKLHLYARQKKHGGRNNAILDFKDPAVKLSDICSRCVRRIDEYLRCDECLCPNRSRVNHLYGQG